MRTYKLKDMKRGWLIGDFEPSVLKTKQFEVGMLTHKKGEKWTAHYHKEAVEFNIIIKGHMIIQDTELVTGDIFVIDKYEVANPVFLQDCTVLVVKVPSVPGDKYEVL